MKLTITDIHNKDLDDIVADLARDPEFMKLYKTLYNSEVRIVGKMKKNIKDAEQKIKEYNMNRKKLDETINRRFITTTDLAKAFNISHQNINRLAKDGVFIYKQSKDGAPIFISINEIDELIEDRLIKYKRNWLIYKYENYID